MSLSLKRFHVSAVLVTRRPMVRVIGLGDLEEAVTIRCTVCGKTSEPLGEDDYAVLLSDLNEWAEQHVCPPLTVN